MLNDLRKDPQSGTSRDETSAPAQSGGRPSTVRNPPVSFTSMANDPEVKMFSTDCGKTIALNRNSVIIQCNDGTYITLVDGAGINVITVDDITVSSASKVSLSGKDIAINAEDKIAIASGASTIKVNPSEIKMRARDIKMN